MLKHIEQCNIRPKNGKNKFTFEIRQLSLKNMNEVIKLIKETYGKNYFDKRYYKKSYLKKFINGEKKYDGTYWKGIFRKERENKKNEKGNDKEILIGQILFTIKKGVGLFRLAIIRKKYVSKGIGKQIAKEFEKLENEVSSFCKCAYAFIDSKNEPLKRILKAFKFIYIGRIPSFNDKKIEIYCRMVSIERVLLTPHYDYAQEIQKMVLANNFRRIFSIEIMSYRRNYKKVDTKVKKRKHKSKNIEKIRYYVFNEKIATLKYNKIEKSWYDFRFVKNITPDIKYEVLSECISEFKRKDIMSFSLTIEVNDKESQNIIVALGGSFYAYMPFYLKDLNDPTKNNDAIIVGFSKVVLS